MKTYIIPTAELMSVSAEGALAVSTFNEIYNGTQYTSRFEWNNGEDWIDETVEE